MTKLFRRKVTLAKGAPVVQKLAIKRANQRMRREILPLLSVQHFRPNSWNPLRLDETGSSAYGVKLRLPDMLAMEILRSKKLMKMTEKILVEETTGAAMTEGKAFVTNIFEQLMSE